MSIYGNIVNNINGSKNINYNQNFQFDKIFSNRYILNCTKNNDDIYLKRSVLVDYDQDLTSTLTRVIFHDGDCKRYPPILKENQDLGKLENYVPLEEEYVYTINDEDLLAAHPSLTNSCIFYQWTKNSNESNYSWKSISIESTVNIEDINEFNELQSQNNILYRDNNGTYVLANELYKEEYTINDFKNSTEITIYKINDEQKFEKIQKDEIDLKQFYKKVSQYDSNISTYYTITTENGNYIDTSYQINTEEEFNSLQESHGNIYKIIPSYFYKNIVFTYHKISLNNYLMTEKINYLKSNNIKSTYNFNNYIDNKLYSKSYDSTVWQKYLNNNNIINYIMIAALNASNPIIEQQIIPPNQNGLPSMPDMAIKSQDRYTFYTSPIPSIQIGTNCKKRQVRIYEPNTYCCLKPIIVNEDNFATIDKNNLYICNKNKIYIKVNSDDIFNSENNYYQKTLITNFISSEDEYKNYFINSTDSSKKTLYYLNADNQKEITINVYSSEVNINDYYQLNFNSDNNQYNIISENNELVTTHILLKYNNDYNYYPPFNSQQVYCYQQDSTDSDNQMIAMIVELEEFKNNYYYYKEKDNYYLINNFEKFNTLTDKTQVYYLYSDENITTCTYDDNLNVIENSELIPGNIYYNKEGFSKENRSYIDAEDMQDIISLTLDGSSGYNYSEYSYYIPVLDISQIAKTEILYQLKEDNSGYTIASLPYDNSITYYRKISSQESQYDINQLNINLPSIGNAMCSFWDLIYGTDRNTNMYIYNGTSYVLPNGVESQYLNSDKESLAGLFNTNVILSKRLSNAVNADVSSQILNVAEFVGMLKTEQKDKTVQLYIPEDGQQNYTILNWINDNNVNIDKICRSIGLSSELVKETISTTEYIQGITKYKDGRNNEEFIAKDRESFYSHFENQNLTPIATCEIFLSHPVLNEAFSSSLTEQISSNDQDIININNEIDVLDNYFEEKTNTSNYDVSKIIELIGLDVEQLTPLTFASETEYQNYFINNPENELYYWEEKNKLKICKMEDYDSSKNDSYNNYYLLFWDDQNKKYNILLKEENTNTPTKVLLKYNSDLNYYTAKYDIDTTKKDTTLQGQISRNDDDIDNIMNFIGASRNQEDNNIENKEYYEIIIHGKDDFENLSHVIDIYRQSATDLKGDYIQTTLEQYENDQENIYQTLDGINSINFEQTKQKYGTLYIRNESLEYVEQDTYPGYIQLDTISQDNFSTLLTNHGEIYIKTEEKQNIADNVVLNYSSVSQYHDVKYESLEYINPKNFYNYKMNFGDSDNGNLVLYMSKVDTSTYEYKYEPIATIPSDLEEVTVPNSEPIYYRILINQGDVSGNLFNQCKPLFDNDGGLFQKNTDGKFILITSTEDLDSNKALYYKPKYYYKKYAKYYYSPHFYNKIKYYRSSALKDQIEYNNYDIYNLSQRLKALEDFIQEGHFLFTFGRRNKDFVPNTSFNIERIESRW